MTGLACLFGFHSPEPVAYFEVRDGKPVVVSLTRCARIGCRARIFEEVFPFAELPESDD